MSPWEVLWIGLGWLAAVAVLLIAALIVLLIAFESLRQLRKQLKKRD